MKRIIYILALTAIVSGVASCNQWLEEQPLTAPTLDELHGEKNMRALVTGAINPLKSLVETWGNLDLTGTDRKSVV